MPVISCRLSGGRFQPPPSRGVADPFRHFARVSHRPQPSTTDDGPSAIRLIFNVYGYQLVFEMRAVH
ncbi:hypothetical protein CGCF413_v000819 [Colletotrichum fructicola]|nr:hypothetical protein CGCF413_v000819 [Colletotrichum fructicola]